MRDYADWRIPWLSMGLLVLLVALTVALAFFQLFLKFDLETSPAWQVGVYYLMLFSFLSIMFVSASIRGLGCGEIFRRVMLALAFLTSVVVFFIGWGLFGAYSGFRDPRLFKVAMMSVMSFVPFWLAVSFLATLVLVFLWCFRRPGGAVPCLGISDQPNSSCQE